jgi:hypothetical protein
MSSNQQQQCSVTDEQSKVLSHTIRNGHVGIKQDGIFDDTVVALHRVNKRH